MPVSLEQITDFAGALDQDALQRNTDKLASLVAGFGGKGVEVRYGTATVTWPAASSICTELTVTHGLGKAPAVAIVTAAANGQGTVFAAHAGAYTTTTFKTQVETCNGFAPGAGATLPVAWIVIG
jgi:hypothetical protein